MIDLVSVTQALLVAEHLSFSRAAQVLGVRQSAVSRRVRALEDKLGVSLFERDNTGVRITEAGRRFLERTRPALAEIDHAMKAAASAGRGAEGVIRIGILSSVSSGFLRNLLEELVAEMTAAFTCATLGITPTVRHADYIGSWLELLREDDRAIVRAASAASKAAEFLLTFRPQTGASESGGAVEDGEAV